jgi:hypothetical protein
MQWVQEKVKEYCTKCEDVVCCNTEKIRIILDSKGTQLFMEQGLPIVYVHELYEPSFEKWLRDKKGQVLDSHKKPIPDPSIIGDMNIPKYRLYTNDSPFCPFLDEENLCKIYENLNRPKSCKQYPIETINVPGTNIIEVKIDESCKYFNTPENRKEMLKILNGE